jgi:hypothetical protein
MMQLQSLFNRFTRRFRQARARRRRLKAVDPRTMPAVWRQQ